MTRLADPLALTRGPAWKNRFMLAPLTNQQSHADGTLSDEEFHWLTMRAQGGFGLTMTCAAHVQQSGNAFAGQLGIFGDQHLEGLTRLADALKAAGTVSSVQLHHGGMRCPKELAGDVVAPSDDAETGARALTTAEVEQLRDDFIAGALRAQKAGFDGVEIHGAHGYILCAFLSTQYNRRDDRYGGSLENRARLTLEVLDGIRAACRPDFQVGLRLSPERFGMELAEIRDLAAEVMAGGKLDYLDMSLWDVFKTPMDEGFAERDLLGWFTDLPRNGTKLGVAGKLMTAAQSQETIDRGCDFAVIGRAAILRHDFPDRVLADAGYVSPATPVSEAHLRAEGLSPSFVQYMRNWKGFVEEAESAA
ncbi:NADH:flavin oxidoreductase [uncultured Albimonas sp.]|uniref:NADH:flavin oxidoreductase n=1 Tax=uncultured Albimonas sp. TaxID=1331701 RepID=UPI0030EF0048|tara:strand:- start:4305 stop:5393 length:1089 start_codon:yes stop_codon:yes gene_type:complete